MRRSMVIGNWKMNGTRAGVAALLRDLLAGLRAKDGVEVGVCVPFVFIPLGAEMLNGSTVLLGAQNVADHESGAFTGEVSGGMLREFDCRLAIVGHPERRLLYGESDRLVAARYRQAVRQGLRPILCLGETLEQREQGRTFEMINVQLDAVLELTGVQALENAVVVYEPFWAIGTGKTATTEQAQEAHQFIRGKITQRNPGIARKVPILYGGSVKPENAAALFAMPDIDGGMIGGASLEVGAFLSICHSISI